MSGLRTRLRVDVIKTPRFVALCVGIVLLGAGLRVWGIGFGLPHTEIRPDESATIGIALRFFSGDFNPHFFHWPSLAFYLAHALMRVVYLAGHVTGRYPDTAAFVASVHADPTWIHMTLRIISASCGVLTLIVVYRLTRDLVDRLTAAVAMFFLSVAFLHVRESHFGILEVPLTLFIVGSVLLLSRAVSDGRLRWWFAAGAAAGIATSLKYNGAALGLVGLVAAVLRSRHEHRTLFVEAAAGLAVFSVTLALVAVAGTPYAVLDWESFAAGITWQWEHLSAGHGVRAENAFVQHLTFSLRHGVGAPVLLLALGGMAGLFVYNWRHAALVAAFPLAYFWVIGSGHTAFVRYAVPLVPFLCVTGAFTVRQLAVVMRRWGPLAEKGALIVLAIAAAAPTLQQAVQFDIVLARRDTRLLAADWLATRVAPGDTLYESGVPPYAYPHLAWRPSGPAVTIVTFDEPSGQFRSAAGTTALPDWIVVAASPLHAYTPVSSAIATRVFRNYRLVQRFTPSRAAEQESWFDQHDAFFLPYATLEHRIRSGPELFVYRRSDRQ